MIDSSGNKQGSVPNRDYTTDEETVWSILQPVVHRWRMNLPFVLLMVGCTAFGTILLTARYDKPAPSSMELVELWMIRAIGLVFLLAPLLILYRLKTGFYDE